MSHFTVAVIHREDQDIDELLERYNENREVEPYKRYTKEEAIAYARQWYVGENETKTDEECYEMMLDEELKPDEDGNLFSTYNPDSKWDWYVVGGRWDCELIMCGENGKLYGCNECKISEMVFPFNQKQYDSYIRWYEVTVEGQPMTAEEDERKFEFTSLYNKKYYNDYYGSKERYAQLQSTFYTFAVVTPDGEWHEQGEMGWFGVHDDTPEEFVQWIENYKKNFIDTAEPDWLITIVDCHI